ncbi:MAG: glycosyltransferase [Cyclobacteriaceae bacterium]
MNIFIIPSWYPSSLHPTTGVFFRDQAVVYARLKPQSNVAISTWGSHDERLWLSPSSPFRSLGNILLPKPRQTLNALEPNCWEYFSPAFTWSRRLGRGNIDSIIEVHARHLEQFEKDRGKVDVIHAHCAYPAGFIAMHLSEQYDIPYIITEHMSPFPLPSLEVDFKTLVLPALNQAKAVLAVSDALKIHMMSHGVRVEPISNFIDDQHFKPNQSDGEGFQILFVGRLEDQKHPQLLMEALALARAHVDWKCLIIGEGEHREQMELMAEELPVKVQFSGWRDLDGLRNAYQSSDVLVMPSRHENQPVVILEAKACGLPIVTTPWAGAEQLVQQHDHLIEPHADQLFEALLKVNEKHSSRFEVRKRYEEKWSSRVTVDKLEHVYQKVIED